MKIYLRLSLILLAFCVVATALLAFVNSATKPRIDELQTKAADEARSTLIP
ncbi:MAG: electron transporter RnfG, partial [Candidatus Cloacimonetes bacterium]|nr:electron transporter RnfG [Candidatus Cloacimonadota bacterium]